MRWDHNKRFTVYILASLSGTLYIGYTKDLYFRVWEHKNNMIEGFTKQYDVDRLVYFETYKYVLNAIRREKQLKGWTRKRKIALLETANPRWEDLARDWYRDDRGPSLRSG